MPAGERRRVGRALPVHYLARIAAGTPVWAPQYTLHKIIMGLLDQHVAGDEQALQVVDAFAAWFLRWTDPMDRAQLDDLLDWETGGMLEVWADLYALTGKPEHLELMRRYDRPRFFDPLLAGHDVLTNKHANTQIPEILGAARAWEVTGEQRWRDIVEAFWDAAVTSRGTYCTGGSTCGEVWQPPQLLSARLNSVQEHCTVYNMMRLADVLFRWTGDPAYADHWEANLANGVLAQQYPDTGMPSYFLPLAAGSTKTWGRPTEDFWCCHGTLIQAHASQSYAAVLTGADEIVVAQYLPAEFAWDELAGSAVRLSMDTDAGRGLSVGQRQTSALAAEIQQLAVVQPVNRPTRYRHTLSIRCDPPTELALLLRVPTWSVGPPTVTVDGNPITTEVVDGFVVLQQIWTESMIDIAWESRLSTHRLPDRPDMVAFLDGPVVLAGLVDHERTLFGDPARPEALLVPDRERTHSWWSAGTYRTVGQPAGVRFLPISEVRDETYSVYFPVVGGVGSGAS